MDKLRYFITGVIILMVALVYVFLVKVQKPGLDMRISLEKDTFLYGEDFDVKYTLENLSDEVDSVLHFSEVFLGSAALIISNKKFDLSYGGHPNIPIGFPFYGWKYTKINPGEKLTELVRLDPLFSWAYYENRFPYGNYILRGLCEKDTGNYIFSNTITFHIIYPKGKDLEAFKEYRYVADFEKRPREGARPPEDRIHLTDKAIEVLYKYPKSVYSGKLLCRSDTYRQSGKYKYDESYLKDMEFFIENNPDSHYLNQLLYHISGLFRNKLGGKEKAVEYLNSLKTKLKNDRWNKLIDEHMVRDEYLREGK